MPKYLISIMSNTELLDLYGYEPYGHATIRHRWETLTNSWRLSSSEELGHLRQIMLRIHEDVCSEED